MKSLTLNWHVDVFFPIRKYGDKILIFEDSSQTLHSLCHQSYVGDKNPIIGMIGDSQQSISTILINDISLKMLKLLCIIYLRVVLIERNSQKGHIFMENIWHNFGRYICLKVCCQEHSCPSTFCCCCCGCPGCSNIISEMPLISESKWYLAVCAMHLLLLGWRWGAHFADIRLGISQNSPNKLTTGDHWGGH